MKKERIRGRGADFASMYLRKIRKQYRCTISSSPFYSKRFGRGDIRSMEEFRGLPFTAKTDVLIDQEKNPPFGSNLCVPVESVIRVHKTSGTTNRPVIIALTRNDIKTTVTVGAKCFILSGLQRKDLVVHCFNYNMWAGGYTDHQSLEEAGAAVIPFGVGNSHALIETILHLRPTAIHCTPSYLSKLEELVQKEFHISCSELGLRLGLFGGESGLQNSDFRSTVEKKWGLKAMNANYGMSEVLSMFGAECSHQSGLHFMGEDVLFPELIDIKRQGSLPIEEGAVGELVLTNLEREAQPLIRYRTGDIIKVLRKRCSCKRSGFQFEVAGRTDNMLVIKGLNVFPSQIEQILNKRIDHIGNMYHVLVSRENPIDTIKLVLELKKESRTAVSQLEREIANDFIKYMDIKPVIEFVNEGELPRSESKSAKILRTL